jgi:DNA replication ATP-dependent helicase Dna2
MSIAEIKAALRAEMEMTPKYAVFNITKVTSTSQGLLLDLHGKKIHGADTATPLTEDFDNTGASWYYAAKGTASVSQVDPKNNQIRLKNLKGVPPLVGQDIFLYPRDFIKPVLTAWEDVDLANQAIACLNDLSHPVPIKSQPLYALKHTYLRPAQRQALNLVTHSASYLFGPPGTGKTTTLGVTKAEFLVANPGTYVLLVSTTNLAVDQALISVDRALERMNETGVRCQLRRIGDGYDRSLYVGREHLLPVKQAYATDDDQSGGDAEETATSTLYSTRIGDASGPVRLQAMTIAYSIAHILSLRALYKFDLVVFDEASQTSLAHTLLIMTLGKACLFAGDPEQLAPIVKSNAQSAQRWLARSPFAYMPITGLSTCFLNEQSRMAGPICTIVSEMFYRGALRVADDALADPYWAKSRRRNLGHISADDHVSLQHITTNASRSRERNGWIRPESAQRAIDLILPAIREGHASQSDIVIITPYRLQRAYLLYQLYLLELSKIKVSTVNSCQGSEAPFVIFDPVRADDAFLMNNGGRQLINVAVSRAQAKLILMLSAQDLLNPIFAKMVAIVDRINKPMTQVWATPALLAA